MASCDAKSVGIITDINTVLLLASDGFFAISETNTWLELASWRHFFFLRKQQKKRKKRCEDVYICKYENSLS